MINENNLQFWIKNNYNVLLRGKAGVGKSACIINAFNKAGLKWLYFSASTLDPWIDFIGIPKEKTNEAGQSYIDLVRPKAFAEDDVEAIFLDEYNRAPRKVLNAVLELIQFKSINGKKFNNLRFIWAAIKPPEVDEQNYNVEELDPAQIDRFKVIYDVPYMPDASYFRKKFGTEKADAAISWWKDLDSKQKDSVSPRRLDYALDMFLQGGDLKWVLPNNVNVVRLKQELNSGSFQLQLKSIYESKDDAKAKAFFKDENNFDGCIKSVLSSKDSNFKSFCYSAFSDEKISGLMSKHKDIEKYVFEKYQDYEPLIKNIANANSSALGRRAKTIVKKFEAKNKAPITNKLTKSNCPIFFNLNSSAEEFNNQYAFLGIASKNLNATYGRQSVYDFYQMHLPKNLGKLDTNPLSVLLHIADKAQTNYTLNKKMPNLSGMINHCISYLINIGNVNWIDDQLYNRVSKKLGNILAIDV